MTIAMDAPDSLLAICFAITECALSLSNARLDRNPAFVVAGAALMA
ncbi:MAG: hypothetical protein MK060_20290 [Blastomonas sp.]|nr:hypothetical protein [Blastomonas sp.]MCH2240216.1 hypothetical protein [Blastomonas sp.]